MYTYRVSIVTLQPLAGREIVKLRRVLGIGRDRLATALGLAPKTLAKVESGAGSLLPSVLDRLAALRHVLAVADDVLGSRRATAAWLLRPHPHYGGALPLDMLRSYSGTVEILRALERIAEGVVS
jgi:putative toxin-antitoxin system antitoxin component (TIGR02293 family)